MICWVFYYKLWQWCLIRLRHWTWREVYKWRTRKWRHSYNICLPLPLSANDFLFFACQPEHASSWIIILYCNYAVQGGFLYELIFFIKEIKIMPISSGVVLHYCVPNLQLLNIFFLVKVCYRNYSLLCLALWPMLLPAIPCSTFCHSRASAITSLPLPSKQDGFSCDLYLC